MTRDLSRIESTSKSYATFSTVVTLNQSSSRQLAVNINNFLHIPGPQARSQDSVTSTRSRGNQQYKITAYESKE